MFQLLCVILVCVLVLSARGASARQGGFENKFRRSLLAENGAKGASGRGGKGGQGGIAISMDGSKAKAKGGNGGKSGGQREKEEQKKNVKREYKEKIKKNDKYKNDYNALLFGDIMDDYNQEIAAEGRAFGGMGGLGGYAISIQEDGTENARGPLAVSSGGCQGGFTGANCANAGIAIAIGENGVALSRSPDTDEVSETGGFALAIGDNAMALGGGGGVKGDGAALSLPQTALLLESDASFTNDVEITEDGEVNGGFVFGLSGAGGDSSNGGGAVTNADFALSVGNAYLEALAWAIGAGFEFSEDDLLTGGISAASSLTKLAASSSATTDESGTSPENSNMVAGETISRTNSAAANDGAANGDATGTASAVVDSDAGEDMSTSVDIEGQVVSMVDIFAGGDNYFVEGDTVSSGSVDLSIETGMGMVAGETTSDSDSAVGVSVNSPSSTSGGVSFRTRTSSEEP